MHKTSIGKNKANEVNTWTRKYCRQMENHFSSDLSVAKIQHSKACYCLAEL